jgi:hypothetical protein
MISIAQNIIGLLFSAVTDMSGMYEHAAVCRPVVAKEIFTWPQSGIPIMSRVVPVIAFVLFSDRME